MTAVNSFYLSVLKNKRIVYMPTCLTIERMTKLYSHVSKIQSQADLARQLRGLLFLLYYFTYEVVATCEAYEESRIKFFVGDWKQDRNRARRLFLNLQVRLAYIGDQVDPASRSEILELSEKLGAAWDHMREILDMRSGPTTVQDSCSRCRYFRSTNTACWQQIMAKAVLSMGGLEDCRDRDSYLMLMCYNRVKAQLVREIDKLERKYNVNDKFPADKILCISDDDTATGCPNCMTMVDSMNKEVHYDTRRITKVATRRLGHRTPRVTRDTHLAMPRAGLIASALASFSRGS